MPHTEFPIDFDEETEGLGMLIVTDARLFDRPAVPGQHYRYTTRDTAHAYSILCLGNDMGQPTTHIVFDGTPEEAFRLLDELFYTFVNACCFDLDCDAVVNYIAADGTIARTKDHGVDNGSYTMRFNVYCGVAADQIEDRLSSLISELDEPDRFIVVRPDLSDDLGYSVRGFIVGSPAPEPTHRWQPEDDYEPEIDDESRAEIEHGRAHEMYNS